MARALPMLASQLLIFSLLSSFLALNLVSAEYAKTMNRKHFGLKKEKLSHFRLYWHDIYSGTKPTAARVVSPVPSNSTTAFGSISMIDNPLTVGPELSSKCVGKAQGFYASAAQEDVSMLMAMTFAFTEGKYNGSTLNILGRNPVFSKERELPVIGGTGLFRFARGYAMLNTSRFDWASGDATVEYNIYVLHY